MVLFERAVFYENLYLAVFYRTEAWFKERYFKESVKHDKNHIYRALALFSRKNSFKDYHFKEALLGHQLTNLFLFERSFGSKKLIYYLHQTVLLLAWVTCDNH